MDLYPKNGWKIPILNLICDANPSIEQSIPWVYSCIRIYSQHSQADCIE